MQDPVWPWLPRNNGHLPLDGLHIRGLGWLKARAVLNLNQALRLFVHYPSPVLLLQHDILVLYPLSRLQFHLTRPHVPVVPRHGHLGYGQEGPAKGDERPADAQHLPAVHPVVHAEANAHGGLLGIWPLHQFKCGGHFRWVVLIVVRIVFVLLRAEGVGSALHPQAALLQGLQGRGNAQASAGCNRLRAPPSSAAAAAATYRRGWGPGGDAVQVSR
mmetsp:Transcript_22887/g.63238  ORF Transcript_22887/g.63238 Transcript_22887/m.63238 type:complete len:216 (+) Transcript_22887:1417-2064(+)